VNLTRRALNENSPEISTNSPIQNERLDEQVEIKKSMMCRI